MTTLLADVRSGMYYWFYPKVQYTHKKKIFKENIYAGKTVQGYFSTKISKATLTAT